MDNVTQVTEVTEAAMETDDTNPTDGIVTIETDNTTNTTDGPAVASSSSTILHRVEDKLGELIEQEQAMLQSQPNNSDNNSTNTDTNDNASNANANTNSITTEKAVKRKASSSEPNIQQCDSENPLVEEENGNDKNTNDDMNNTNTNTVKLDDKDNNKSDNDDSDEEEEDVDNDNENDDDDENKEDEEEEEGGEGQQKEEEDENEEEEGVAGGGGKSGGKKSGGRQTDDEFKNFIFDGQQSNVKDFEEIDKDLSSETDQWKNKDSCVTAKVPMMPHFTCVKYPGIIRNKERALVSFGGPQELGQARDNGKLDIKLRPEDPYCKAAVGVFKKNNHLLVRCLRRKKKGATVATATPPTPMPMEGEEGEDNYDPNDTSDDGYEYKVEVLGFVTGIFSFETPSDYQYLPCVKKADGTGYEEILSKIMLTFEDERMEFLNREVPLFLPPYVFSRAERPAKYFFQDDRETDSDFIGIARKKRCKGTQRMDFFKKGPVPMAPNKDAITAYETSNNTSNLDPLKALFAERPLWSKVGLVSRLKRAGHHNLRHFIYMVAYYWGTGPWLHMWCRFTYDPRTTPYAKHYQTVDFRIRKTWNREKVTAKRGSDHYLGLKRKGFNTIKGHRLPEMSPIGHATQPEQAKDTAEDIDLHYQYVPGRIPPYRQMFYQVCDVLDDNIQALLHQNDGQEEKCTEKDGWCINDFTIMSRDIMAEETEKILEETFQQTEEGVAGVKIS